ncbi:unnamed protein product [Pleuronectes platessa]|uniref:Uncharacterized protein n=1 Tax=Pleuronectes platessa TaxID=8262 RepID=A0A9N7YKG8_PLEPL|nr:unnamed protein product [Pleuronectes platessa]
MSERETGERETRYVLRAMLRDQGRGLGEVRDVWGVRGQGSPVSVTPWLDWDTVIEDLGRLPARSTSLARP